MFENMPYEEIVEEIKVMDHNEVYDLYKKANLVDQYHVYNVDDVGEIIDKEFSPNEILKLCRSGELRIVLNNNYLRDDENDYTHDYYFVYEHYITSLGDYEFVELVAEDLAGYLWGGE